MKACLQIAFFALLATLTVLPAGSAGENGDAGDDLDKLWAFRPVADPLPPAVRPEDEAWVMSPIDRFVIAKLRGHGLRPQAAATKRVLIRRASFDLTGLPPTPEDVVAFIEDGSPDAFARVVDRLLASPRYGERWARHWLDVARFAEEQREENHVPKALPHAWRYRDWVVDALNADMRYDEFLVKQIAGDQSHPQGDRKARAALGFLALGPVYESDAGDDASKLIARYDTIDDKIDTLTRGLLGLTVACSRCHDHKFDPIPAADYYALAGVFFHSHYIHDMPVASREEVKRVQAAKKQSADLKQRLDAAIEAQRPAVELAALRKEFESSEKLAQRELPMVHALAESGDGGGIPIALRGNPNVPGEVEPRRFLGALGGLEAAPFTQGSGRLELARAITNPSNPLTSRVIVNRVWLHHFGAGLVRSPDNFGALGERPSHPELLDWLASRFVERGWSLKQLHREIMLSATYQLSSERDEAMAAADGDNRWLWRMNPRRLEVEALRDAMLFVSGELDPMIGGPSVDDILSSNRRTLYATIRRDSRERADKFLQLFDFPDARVSNNQRAETTVAQQQLFFLNSAFVIARAKALAARAGGDDYREKIGRIYRIVFQRSPTTEEIRLGEEYLTGPAVGGETAAEKQWEQYVQAILGSNEFVYLQ